jgi:hypothetical protein
MAWLAILQYMVIDLLLSRVPKQVIRRVLKHLTPPENDKFNPQHPPSYNLTQLPMRTEEEYWKVIEALESSRSKAQKSKIIKDPGISRLPLCAASEAFTRPAFFPLDPFHLFYENSMAFIWDLWTIHTKPDEINLHLQLKKHRNLGRQYLLP